MNKAIKFDSGEWVHQDDSYYSKNTNHPDIYQPLPTIHISSIVWAGQDAKNCIIPEIQLYFQLVF